MLNGYPPAERGTATPPDRWRLRQQSRLAEATAAGDQRELQKMRGLGLWSTVFVDCLLLLLFLIVLSILLVVICTPLIGIHDGDFTHGIFSGDGLSRAVKSTNVWVTSPYGLAVGNIVAELAIWTTLFVRVLGPHMLTWADLGYGATLRDRPIRSVCAGVGAALAAIAVSLVVVAILEQLKLPVNGQEDTLKAMKTATIPQRIAVGFTVVIAAPIAEETFFRGYLLKALTVRYGLVAGLVVTSTAFGALHLLGGVTWEFIAIGMVGAILGFTYSRTGNLISNVTAHALFNTFGLAVLYTS